jgi:hypothetical protein
MEVRRWVGGDEFWRKTGKSCALLAGTVVTDTAGVRRAKDGNLSIALGLCGPCIAPPLVVTLAERFVPFGLSVRRDPGVTHLAAKGSFSVGGKYGGRPTQKKF